MTNTDKAIIRAFAGGDKSLREQAIEIHRREIKQTGAARGTPEMDFMAELDNPCPDLLLRGMYRRKLLQG